MILGLDTSTLTLSLALARVQPEGRPVLLEEARWGPPERQSERLPGAIELLLSGRHGQNIDALTGLAVGLGPGSFTGLRIGLATVKALAYARKLPIGGVSSLAAAALDGPEGVPLWIIAVARLNDLYLGRYHREGTTVRALGPEEALTPEALADRLRQEPKAVVLGPAVQGYGPKLVELGFPAARILMVGDVPSAAHVVELANLPNSFDAQAVFALEPHYIRSSGAEANPKFPPLPGEPPVARIKDD